MSEHVAVGRLAARSADQGSALTKLLLFSVALGVAPLSSYYLSLWYLWHGNAMYAAITAVALANLVLVIYIIVSVQEGNHAGVQPSPATVETKKTQ